MVRSRVESGIADLQIGYFFRFTTILSLKIPDGGWMPRPAPSGPVARHCFARPRRNRSKWSRASLRPVSVIEVPIFVARI